MKITFFRLKGYVKVLNGMGLDEIVIPFNNFKNRIVLVQGENGCSKSTIISALSPNPDSSDSFRTDVFVDEYGIQHIIEYPAEKEIHYIDIDESGQSIIYRILIQSIVDDSRTKRTTRAYISKNGEELNPNGNITSFKEIRDSVLGIDPIYLDLSSITSENRGLVDMIPSERRKYMAAYIGSLDTYNNIFKVISKKVNSLKSYMNTLNSKIYELGDENELRLKFHQIEDEQKRLNEQRDSLLRDLSKAETVIKMIDPDNKIQSLYAGILERLETLKSKIQENHNALECLYSKLNLSPNTTDFTELYKSTEETIDSYKSRISDNKIKIQNNINLNEVTFTSLESDRTMLQGLESNSIQSNIEEVVNKLSNEVASYSSYLLEEDIKVLDTVSLDELIDLRDSFSNFLHEISLIEELYSKDLYDKAVELVFSGNSDNTKVVNDLRDESKKIEQSILIFQLEGSRLAEDLKEVKSFNQTRPKQCKIDTCPYISKYISMKDSDTLNKEIEACMNKLNNKATELKTVSAELDDAIKIDDIMRRLIVALAILDSKKSMIKRIGKLKKILDNKYLSKKLMSFYKFPETEVLSSLVEKKYIYIDLQKAKEQLSSLEADLRVYKNNRAIVESLVNSISTNEKIYNDREKEIKTLSDECGFLEKVLSEYSEKFSLIENLLSLKTEESGLIKEKEELKDEFNSIKTNMKTITDSINSIDTIKSDIKRIENVLNPLNEDIDKLKYALCSIVEYKEEYNDSSVKYDKMVFVRNACSPGNGLGIQSEYIKRYMNDIIIDCNKILGFMFNGSIQLDIPIINEKQFSIPFFGPNGIVVPDISNGSTAQKCMIGLVFSCIAMMKSSMKYNIPRFDEIDGGLDQQNRILFIDVLNKILDFMYCEQCIICSHNSEFDTQNTTRLICSHSGIRIEE